MVIIAVRFKPPVVAFICSSKLLSLEYPQRGRCDLLHHTRSDSRSGFFDEERTEPEPAIMPSATENEMGDSLINSAVAPEPAKVNPMVIELVSEPPHEEPDTRGAAGLAA